MISRGATVTLRTADIDIFRRDPSVPFRNSFVRISAATFDFSFNQICKLSKATARWQRAPQKEVGRKCCHDGAARWKTQRVFSFRPTGKRVARTSGRNSVGSLISNGASNQSGRREKWEPRDRRASSNAKRRLSIRTASPIVLSVSLVLPVTYTRSSESTREIHRQDY